MKQTKAVLVREAVVGYPAIAEHKVAGEVYIPGVDAVPCDPGEVQVTMTVDEAQKVQAILYTGVSISGNIPGPSGVWRAIEVALGASPYRCKSGKILGNGPDARVGWPYLIRR